MEDPQYHFANTDEGREVMIKYLETFDREVMQIAADYFITIPPQLLEIVRVPEYSEDSSPAGYYNGPALHGSRPRRRATRQRCASEARGRVWARDPTQ